MGLFGFIKSQFIEVIEWTDDSSDTLVYRFPVANKEIKMGAQLTVREAQNAVFVNEGQIADVFSPGRYQLSTANLPILTKLKSWKYGFNSPFKAEVYFVNTKQFTQQKWGTANPIIMRDREFGMLRLRAYGVFAFRAVDPAKLLKEVFGTSGHFTSEEIVGQLRSTAISGLSDLLAESQIAALDISMHYDELSEQAAHKLRPRFAEYGLDITSFTIENVSLPKEVEAVLDKRTSMGIVGDLGRYAQYQAAEALREAANNEGGGVAAAGVGLGAGAALGKALTQAMSGEPAPTPTPAPAAPVSQPAPQTDTLGKRFCPECGMAVPESFKFCPGCGNSLATTKKCSSCGFEADRNMKFCPECGQKL
ncbi:MAG: SPFH domain-containing protein [Bacillota bacterium]